MKKLVNLLALLTVVTLFNHAGADIYRWVDKDGTIHYTNTPRGKEKAREIKQKINSYSSPKVSSFKYDPASISKHRSSSKVVMYSTTWCGYCKKARRYFNQQKINFKEYDVERSTRGKKDYKALKGKGVPVILVGNRRMDGFSVAGFNRIYR